MEAVTRGSDLWYESPGRPEAEADAHSAEADAHSAEADEVQIGGLRQKRTRLLAGCPGHPFAEDSCASMLEINVRVQLSGEFSWQL